jgi:hypothetical protein
MSLRRTASLTSRRDVTWFLSVAMLTETCANLGDKPRAALLYEVEGRTRRRPGELSGPAGQARPG